MANKTTFVIQAFERKLGRLVPGSKDVAPTQKGTVKRAEAPSSRMPGTAAVSVVADETGEAASISMLQTFGEIPDDFAESLVG